MVERLQPEDFHAVDAGHPGSFGEASPLVKKLIQKRARLFEEGRRAEGNQLFAAHDRLVEEAESMPRDEARRHIERGLKQLLKD